jgi:glycosyltransferase involved in cell wall biosynthesis
MPATISVIIPAYNRADLIGATLDAVSAQTLRPLEVIVVDDGSTDDSAAVAAAHDGVTVIRVANGGAANARHVGVRASAGELLAFCDSDDLWLPDHLAGIAAAFERRDDLGFLFSDFRYFQDGRWKDSTKFAEAPDDFWAPFASAGGDLLVAGRSVVEEILRFQPIFPSCTAMLRSFYDAIGGYDPAFGRLPSEDLEFTLRCVMQAPVGLLRRATVGIRRHPGNHSADHVRQLGGEIRILAHSRAAHGADAATRRALTRAIETRTAQAIDGAFARRMWSLFPLLLRHAARSTWSPRRAIKILLALLLYLPQRMRTAR